MKAPTLPGKTKRQNKPKDRNDFSARAFLNSTGMGRRIVEYLPSERIYFQGDPASSVQYIKQGRVKLSVVNKFGKEAVVALLGPSDFFGEGGIVGQPVRARMATAITPVTLLAIENNEMIRLLRVDHKFTDRFISYMLSRNFRCEEDLVDQLFNSSEKRLARALLLMANYGSKEPPQRLIPRITQEELADMIGTTRSRVNYFLREFTRKGFIGYEGGLHVNSSLLNVVLEK